MSSGTVAESVQAAIAALSCGRMIVLIDDADRENEGDLVVAAELITEAQMAFFVRHTTGIVCAAMPETRANELRLPPMVAENSDPRATAFTVSVDLVGTGTGVSAAARSATMRALAARDTQPDALQRPGHVFPLRARREGVLGRAGHTEATVDLLHLAGMSGVGVISELVNDDGAMQTRAQLHAFARQYDLTVLEIADLVRYRYSSELIVEPGGTARLPTEAGDFCAVAYRDVLHGTEHLALVKGDPVAAARTEAGALVRMHSECLTGDVLGSLRCDCGCQLRQSLEMIAAEGCGVVVYLRGREGRGIGLAHKVRAYALQDEGFDTVDANIELGLPVDARSYVIGAQILSDLGVSRIRLITNNPGKSSALRDYGLKLVGTVALQPAVNPHNLRYLRTKRDRLGHELGLETGSAAAAANSG